MEGRRVFKLGNGAATREPSGSGSVIVWVVVAAGLAFMILAVIFAGRLGTDLSISSSPLIGESAPNSVIEFTDGSGSVRIEDLRGEILVINYWASWCIGCRSEHEALMAAADAYKESGVTFVAINYQDTPKNAAAFLDELGRSPFTIYTVDTDSRTAFEWGVIGLPETFFVDREGVVVGKISGPVSYGLLAKTIDRIIVGEIVGETETGSVENR